MFDTKIYRERRQRLRGLIDGGLVLLPGNGESAVNYADNVYPFRQDSTFLYFCGLDTPHLAAVIDIDGGDEILFGDEATLDDIVWSGPQPTLAERAEPVGISDVRPTAALADVITAAANQGRAIHYLPPYRGERVLQLNELFGKKTNGISTALIDAVVALRSIKSPEEIAAIERAVDLTAAMHLAAMRCAHPGMTEAQVAAAVLDAALQTGGRTSFPTILTVHGETLHNVYQGNVLQEGDLVLCDAGGETAAGYAGDMTRVFPAGAKFSPQQIDIHAVVLAAHDAAVAALEPDVPYRDVHLIAARALAGGLKDLGLMKGDLDTAVQEGAHALFFPHGLGHMMGLDVHDMEDLGEDHVGYGERFDRSEQFGLRSLRLARELQPGFVLTVEPGCYFIEALIDRWQTENKFTDFIDYRTVAAYRGLGGVRIEDDYVITTDGARRLGKPLVRSVTEIEAVRAEALA